MNSVASPSTPTRGERTHGGLGFATDAFFAQLARWHEVLPGTAAFLLAAALVATLVHTFDLPGGVLPALPVLTMPLVPHSWRLFWQRIVTIGISCTGCYLLGTILQQQPWLLLPFIGVYAFVGFYLTSRGLDMFNFMVLVGTPVLLLWQGSVGRSLGEVCWQSSEQLLVGTLVSGSIGLVFLRGGFEQALRERVAARLEGLAAVFRTPPHRESETQPEWSIKESAITERMLARLRAEQGRTVRCRNLHTLAECLRLLMGLNSVRRMLYVLPHPPGFVEAQADAAMPVRLVFADRLVAIAAAVRARHAVGALPSADAAIEAFERRCIELNAANDGDRPSARGVVLIESVAVLYRSIDLVLGLAAAAIGPKVAAIPEAIPIPTIEERSCWRGLSVLAELVHLPNRWSAIFAAKGAIVTLIAFSIASVFPDWGGSTVLLLMSMLLTSLNMGGVAASFSARLVGLIGSLIASLLAILVFLPNAPDPWVYAAILVAALAPGAIAMQSPATSGIGLSFAMTVFFTLTSSDTLSVSLDPIQQRFASVGGATLLAWLVFLLIRPVYARERIGDGLAMALEANAALLRFGADPPRDADRAARRRLEIGLRSKAHDALAALDGIIVDAQTEIGVDPERLRILESIRGSIERQLLLARTFARIQQVRSAALAGSEFAGEVGAAAVAEAERADGLAAIARDPDPEAVNREETPVSDRDAMLAVVDRAATELAPADANLVGATMTMLTLLDRELIACRGELKRRGEVLEAIRRVAIGGTDSPVGVAATS